ncbi:hypothetical protein HK098_005985 [Nowakowskiella sp. JEL0407]|nr:hypothetical protein HK098_005985 [Nowakowskiella sp. JEL0407]
MSDQDPETVPLLNDEPQFNHSPLPSLLRKPKTLLILAAIALIAIVSLIIWRISATPGSWSKEFGEAVILISVDGFRREYLSRNLSSTLNSLGEKGVMADYMLSSFPSVTFPNHYSIVTGLYPESHGIVGNTFFDPTLNDSFSYGNVKNNQDPKWWGGEPIWVTAVKQGKRSATMMWPGSEAPIQNIRPTYWYPFDWTWTAEAKVDQLLKWLDLPERKRPHLLTMYLPEVDHQGHSHGVYSTQVNSSITLVDAAIEKLVLGLRERKLTDKVNIMVVSDHGMTDLSKDRLIFMDDYVDVEKEVSRIIQNGPISSVYPIDEDVVYEKLLNASSQPDSHWSIYKKSMLPSRFHYSHNERIGPLIIIPDLGWDVTLRKNYDPNAPLSPIGTHGFDPEEKDMNAIFIASGPSIDKATSSKKRSKIPWIRNIEVYEIMSKILKLVPATNNGTSGGIIFQ